MKRLTIRNSDGTVSQPMNTTVEQAFHRLADYEDTGVTPEEIRAGRDTGPVNALLEALQAGECKGVKGATAHKVQQFAAMRGFI